MSARSEMLAFVLGGLLIVLYGCGWMYECEVSSPGYWPDGNDPTGILVDTVYIEETVDNEGRTWMYPANCRNVLYRKDSNGKVSEFEFNRKLVDMTSGFGSIWAIGLPNNELNTNKSLLEIDPDTATVKSQSLLSTKLGPTDVSAGKDYVWVYGRLNERLFDFTYQLAVLQIDPVSLSTINTYVVPDAITTDDGQKLNPIGEPRLVLINEAGFLIILVPTKEFVRGNFTYVQLDLHENIYSILDTPLGPAEFCPEKSQVVFTDYGKTAQNKGLGLEDCI